MDYGVDRTALACSKVDSALVTLRPKHDKLGAQELKNVESITRSALPSDAKF